METILVNKLPTRTWNRLGVNETALLWDEAGAVDGGTEVLSADGRLELSADAPYARRTVEITAARGQRVTVYEMFRGGDHLHVRTVLRPERARSSVWCRCRSWMSTPSCAARSRPTVRRAAPWSCTACFPAGATPTPTTG